MSTPRIAAIITCFYPKANELLPLIKSVAHQVETIFLINNGGLPEAIQAQLNHEKIQILHPGQNLGTAGGYNVGSKRVWNEGYTHVLLLDQDSECAPDMVEQLASVENSLKFIGKKVAVVGPYYISKTNNLPAPFIQHEGYRIKRIYETSPTQKTQNGQRYTECSYVISSGSLISRAAWQDIGDKNEGLFLDFTDIEWGLRAKAKGYTCYGSFSARMFHIIGDEQISFLGRKISLHTPLRHYYAFRNCVWLFKQTYIPFGTRTNYLVKLVPKLLIYSWFSSEPLSQLKSMLRGIVDGVLNRMGAFQK